MRIIHEINTPCQVVSGDSGPRSPVTVSIICPKTNELVQPRDEFVEIEGDLTCIVEALEEAAQQLRGLEKLRKEDEATDG